MSIDWTSRSGLVATIRSAAGTNQRALRFLNALYVDVIATLTSLASLVPGPLRVYLYRILLRECGSNCSFDRAVYIKFPSLVRVGSNVSFNRGVEIYPGFMGSHRVVIGDDVYIAPHVRFFAAGHDLDDLTVHQGADIVVGDGVWIGASALVLPGVDLGDGSVVGAGSVVTASVEPGAIVAGNPARIIGRR